MHRAGPGGHESLSRDARIGTTVLGSFHVLRRLGGGSFGTAYLARQLGTERHAVVKIPHRHLMEESAGDARIRSRFAAELRASTRVHHPHIAVVYTAGDTDDGMPAIAMEYVPGPTLARQLAAGAPLQPAQASRLGVQLASALAAVHASGIIHRDVTPRNVIAGAAAGGRPRYVLVDFGIAKLDGLANRTLGVVGTPRYMAPEQMRGAAVPASDMFGLGAILWWALTGEEYLAHIRDLTGLMLHQLDRREPPDPRRLRPSLPAPVAELVSRLLHPAPEQRPSARELLAAWLRLTYHWDPALSAVRPAVAAATDPGAATAATDRDDATGATGDPDATGETISLDDVTGETIADGAPLLRRTFDTSEPLDPDAAPRALAGRRDPCDGAAGCARDSQPMHLPTTLERFLGVMPEWLADVQEAAQRSDGPAIVRVCTRIADSARLMGADQLARLGEILAGLAEDDILDQSSGFVREMAAEFRRWFRELLDARPSSL